MTAPLISAAGEVPADLAGDRGGARDAEQDRRRAVSGNAAVAQVERKRGRPTVFDDELADVICSRLAGGESLNAICADPHMPCESTVRAWAVDDHEGFYARYARARQIAYLAMGDELVDLADTARGEDLAGVQAVKLAVDTRKWMLARMLPKVFGDRLHLEGDREVNVGVQVVLPANGRDGHVVDHQPAPPVPAQRED